MDRGVLTQNGFASSVNEIWNSSPSMVLICSSKTVGNSSIISSAVGIPLVLADSAALMLCGGGRSTTIELTVVPLGYG